MPDLLLEVLSEEIPARMQAGGASALKEQVTRRLEEARLEFEGEDVKSFSTPRRLALIVPGLPAEQPDIRVERKGPRVDAPQKAIDGFLKSTGLTLAECEQRETPKGPVWFAVSQEKGRPTAAVLANLLPQALAAVSWPKSMRWEASGTRWVRPIRSILCLLNSEVVPFRFGAVESGRTTLGHRFLSSGTLTVDDVGSYEAILEDAKVMLSWAARGNKIAGDAKELAEKQALEFPWDHKLAGENAGLVEWPLVLIGRIDEHFMDLPTEVLRTSMRTHQRYFNLRTKDGRSAPRFVMVANTETESDSATIRTGNERVLRARLADACFFWDQDRRVPLADHLPQLEGVVFHARLGSMYDKARRIERLARILCDKVRNTVLVRAELAVPDQAARAGLLCKADLVTQMVGEFPDLQGIMGRHYAEADGEIPAVSEAIREHYAPQGPDDLVPTAPVSVAVALADKLDTLVGFFAIDERPTGSKDPFALRRSALGVIRLIVENEPRLPLGEALDDALAGYGELLPEKPGLEATRDALLAFFAERLKSHLRDRNVRHDLVSAVFALGEDDLLLVLERAHSLNLFLETDDGGNLLTAYRRAANILRIEEKKDGRRYEGAPDPALFAEEEERNLYKCISKANAFAEEALEQEIFVDAMANMEPLRAPVDAFFDNVTVNCDDPALRRNRLLMLSQIRATLDRVADFSKIEG